MADQYSAQEALYESIEQAAKEIKANLNAYSAAEPLRELAWAWRALSGGAQPGGVIVEK